MVKNAPFVTRQYEEMVVVGVLALTDDIWNECLGHQRISWKKLETCKHHFFTEMKG